MMAPKMDPKRFVGHHFFWFFMFTLWFFMFNLVITYSMLMQLTRQLQTTSTNFVASLLPSNNFVIKEETEQGSPSFLHHHMPFNASTTSSTTLSLSTATYQQIVATTVPLSNKTRSKPQYAIFYNIFINPANVSWGVGIIEEQTKQMFTHLSQQGRVDRVPLYYNMIGFNYTHRFCPANMTCNFMNYYEHAFEEATLQKLYDYCVDHPHDRVYYLHDKGSYTPEMYNEVDRRDFTDYTLGEECDHMLHNKTLRCNVAAKRWQAWPHWLARVNFWLAKCSYVRKLIPPKDFTQARTDMFQRLLQPTTAAQNSSYACLRSFFENATTINDLSSTDAHLIGMGRYNYELWIYSHPDVVPCDGPSTMLGNVMEDNWAWYPYAYHEWFRMHGRLFEFYQLYGKLPRKSSFFWNFYREAIEPIAPTECQQGLDRSSYYRAMS